MKIKTPAFSVFGIIILNTTFFASDVPRASDANSLTYPEDYAAIQASYEQWQAGL